MNAEYKVWEEKEEISPCSSESYYAEKAWDESRRKLIDKVRKLEWAPCVLAELIETAGLDYGN